MTTTNEENDVLAVGYTPDEATEEAIRVINEAVTDGISVLNAARREFNDMSAIERDSEDFERFNTYQSNDGIPNQNDPAEAWRSNAIRPVERNKVISMAGHASNRLGFVKITAMSPGSVPDESASVVVNSLMDWVRANKTSDEFWVNAILTAEISPAAYIHEEYREIYRKRKTTRKSDGTWNYKSYLDEELSGIQLSLVPFEQVLFPNITEPNIQRQDWIVWLRYQTYDAVKAKYGKHSDFQYVKPGFRTVSTETGYQQISDPVLEGSLCEEAIYYSKNDGGVRMVKVNDVLVSEPDGKMKREDGLYPFAKFGYEMIRPDFALYKSLVFKVSRDANIINTLYPVLVDGAILDSVPPTFMTGADMVDANVIIPGVNTSVSSPDAKVSRILPPMTTLPLMQGLSEVEHSLTESADTHATGSQTKTNVTNYQLNIRENEIEQAIGPFRSMLLSASIQITKLVLGDIIQHMTALDAVKTVGSGKPVYRSFLSPVTGAGNKVKNRNIVFDDLSQLDTAEKQLQASYDVMTMQGNGDTEIMKADPKSLRELSMMIIMTDDILRPRSESAKFERNKEMFDKLIMASQAAPGTIDLAKAAKDLLLVGNETTARDPESYILEKPAQQPMSIPNQPMI